VIVRSLRSSVRRGVDPASFKYLTNRLLS
jgi:hypothetical protein